MRKVDPNLVIDEFRSSIADSLKDWQTIDGALNLVPVAVRRKAATDAFFSLAVNWESFMSDWWIAAINRGSSAFVANLEVRLRDHAKSTMRLEASELSGTLITKAHLNVDAVRRLVDPNGNNLIFRAQPDLKKAAEKELQDPYKSKAVNISSTRWQVANVTRVIRNALAHQSQGAIDEVNDLLVKSTTKPAFRWTGQRQLSIAGIRRYLRTPDVNPRIVVFHTEFDLLAAALRV